VTGEAGMIGERGRALTAIGKGAPGRAAAHGEIWNATSEDPVAEGDEVVVVAVQGLTLSVRRAGSRGVSEGGA
jgi:membrane-bound serine protease (ClpP class)